ncbi:MAG TPA: hypothetical protein VD794_12940 [Flavisolibacter sp.]|nr:hypothetical protein [Flavisolibacter sp.]
MDLPPEIKLKIAQEELEKEKLEYAKEKERLMELSQGNRKTRRANDAKARRKRR